jgi:hypothetical protein
MACGYTGDEIEKLVVGVYRGILNDPSITRFSRFGPNEIDIDSHAKRLFFLPIKQTVDRVPDCIVTKLTPGDCQSAKTVQDIIDEICDEFGL